MVLGMRHRSERGKNRSTDKAWGAGQQQGWELVTPRPDLDGPQLEQRGGSWVVSSGQAGKVEIAKKSAQK